MTAVDDRHILWIQGFDGGTTKANAKWGVSMTRLMRRSRAVQESNEFESPFVLTVEFHVPGAFSKPNFDGIRAGGFSRKYSVLVVKVALQEQTPNDPEAELLTKLNGAIEVAENWAAKRSMPTPLVGLRDLVVRIAEHVAMYGTAV